MESAASPPLSGPDALATLVETHRERLLRTIALRLHPSLVRRLAPEDVLQEAWLAAAARLKHRASAAYSSDYLWLRAIVLQTIIDFHRHHLGAGMRDALREAAPPGHASATTMAALLAGGGGVAADLGSPSGEVMQAETSSAVALALDQLGDADREIIALRHFEDLGNNEVAEILGIQVKAASIRYVRAVMRLKELLASRGVSLGDLRGR